MDQKTTLRLNILQSYWYYPPQDQVLHDHPIQKDHIPISIPIQLEYHQHLSLHQYYLLQDQFHKRLLLSSTESHHHRNHFDKYQTRVHNLDPYYRYSHHRNHLTVHNHLDLRADHLLSSVQFWYCKLVLHHRFHLQYHRGHLHYHSSPITVFLLLQILHHQEHPGLLKIAGHRYILYHAKYHSWILRCWLELLHKNQDHFLYLYIIF